MTKLSENMEIILDLQRFGCSRGFFLLEKNDAEMDYGSRWVCVCSISVINLAVISRQPAIFRVKREVLDTDQRLPASLILLEIPKLVSNPGILPVLDTFELFL